MVLKNARHELFAQAISTGKSPSDAYVMAGFMPNSGNASRLNATESVRQRVSEIHGAMAARAVKQVNYTREWVIEQLIDNVAQAKVAQDFGAANVALKLLGNERHMFIDRKESGAPGDFAGLTSADEVLDLVRKELGDDTAAALAAALSRQDAVETAEDQASATPVIEAARGAEDTLN